MLREPKTSLTEHPHCDIPLPRDALRTPLKSPIDKDADRRFKTRFGDAALQSESISRRERSILNGLSAAKKAPGSRRRLFSVRE
jgi:hypothetical protein